LFTEHAPKRAVSRRGQRGHSIVESLVTWPFFILLTIILSWTTSIYRGSIGAMNETRVKAWKSASAGCSGEQPAEPNTTGEVSTTDAPSADPPAADVGALGGDDQLDKASKVVGDGNGGLGKGGIAEVDTKNFASRGASKALPRYTLGHLTSEKFRYDAKIMCNEQRRGDGRAKSKSVYDLGSLLGKLWGFFTGGGGW
jgi:hypothetical protein